MSTNAINLYQDTESLACDHPSQLAGLLNAHGHFSVFLEFTDPVSGNLVQQAFPFYPKAVKCPGGGYHYLTRHRDMIIRLPADPYWWFKEHRTDSVVPQKTTALVEGEFVNVQFDVTVVSTAIRLPSPERWQGILNSQAA